MGTPKLFILSEQMRGASFSLTLDKYTIGRADDCDVCVSDPTISGHHCFLVKVDGDAYALQDNGSTNGTKVNSQPVTADQSIKLKNGDILQVGGVEMLYDDIEGDRVESRTISVINLDDTGTGEVNRTAMKNLGDKFSRKSTALRDNRKQNMVINIVIGLLIVVVLGLLALVLLKK